jgi:hypothetical protein
MSGHSHIDFRAIPSKLNLIHARSHKMNSSSTVSSLMSFGIGDVIGIESGSFITNQDR